MRMQYHKHGVPLSATRALGETRAFLEPLLQGRRRVLDVGCGQGELAQALAWAGHEVTALDVKLPMAPAPVPGLTWHEEGFLTFESEPFDAILFVTSLHHLSPLADAVEQARRLLVPGGLLLVEEFALEAPDATTARWYYGVQELLAAAGRYPPERITGDASMDPLERWRHAHEHEPLSEGRRMREEVGRRLELLDAREGPYLYRYLVAGVAEAVGGDIQLMESLSAQLFEAERRDVASGVLKPVGLRLVARKP
ncbi:class I SAM-dependent methyltransferase [Pyxidicoccus xibeiensis]|uniref:class I SAM-dependent methyltransferase n=1 Tax=Pyxidicoccus xibeiensis TaxID=2906759 RepID=UPI0020A76404|nr:class I SAM-dependent methyltransferase [Pyxidicoccus xibeiensis]MCP3140718.1 class I SAM-dependent methyltransferase [Pyxidicoccus xibeiensis]